MTETKTEEILSTCVSNAIRVLSVFLIVCCSTLYAQDEVCFLSDANAAPRERYVDMIHLDAELVFIPDSGIITGVVTHTFRALRPSLDSLYLDGINMNVFKALHNGNPIKYRWYEKGITFYFQKPLRDTLHHTLSIVYKAHPRRGMYFIGWDDLSGRARKQIWTQGQGIDNRHWIPVFDDLADKVTTDFRLRFHRDYEVLSNGQLIAKTPAEGDFVWHYRMNLPHSPYLMMIGIGKYGIEERKSKSGVPLRLYYYPEWKNRVETTYRHSVEIFDFLQSQIDYPFPWGSYAQIPVQDYLYGAMENTSATVFGDFFQTDSISFNDRNYVYVNGHELAHQWFGDLVTARSGAHHWLQESFATYWHQQVMRKFTGEAEYRYELYKNAESAERASRNNMRPVAHSHAGSERHYLKGSYVLHMLHYVSGDEIFRKSLALYLQRHAFANATTDDLLYAFYDASGLQLNRFWDQWIKKGGEPNYKILYDVAGDKKEKKHRVVLQQTLDSAVSTFFEMPIWFHAYYANGRVDSVRIWNRSPSDTVYFPHFMKNQLLYIVFDKGNNILKKESYEFPASMLMAQAQFADYDIDRMRAIKALQTDTETTRTDYLVVNLHETRHYSLQVAAFEKWVQTDSLLAWKNALEIKNTKFWVSVFQNPPVLPVMYKSKIEALLQLPSYELKALLLELLCLQFPKDAPMYLTSMRDVSGTNGNNVRIKWLMLSAVFQKDTEALKILSDMCTNSYDFLTRINAAAALRTLNYCSELAAEGMIQGVFKSNWKLSAELGKTLRQFYTNPRFRPIIDTTVGGMRLTEEQRERIVRLLNTPG